MKKLLNKKYNLRDLTNYRGVFMGLAIISIIVFHYVDDCFMYKYHCDGWVNVYNIFISSGGVDLFLLLSGFGLYYSFKKNNDVVDFYKKRFVKLLIPYIVFCLPALVWKNMMFYSNGILGVLKDFTFFSFFTYGDRWFWYICICLICYLLFPYLFSYLDDKNGNLVSKLLILVILSFLFNTMLALYLPIIFNNIGVMTLRFIPFILGIGLGKLSYERKSIKILDILIFIFVLFIIFILRDPGNVLFIRSSVFASVLIICILLLSLFKLIDDTVVYCGIKKVLEKIGEYTLELYLTHICFRYVFTSYGFYTYYIGYYLLVILISIIVSIGLKAVCSVLTKRFI